MRPRRRRLVDHLKIGDGDGFGIETGLLLWIEAIASLLFPDQAVDDAMHDMNTLWPILSGEGLGEAT